MSNTLGGLWEAEPKIATAATTLARGAEKRNAVNAFITRQVRLEDLQKLYIQLHLGSHRNEKGELWGGFDSIIPFELVTEQKEGQKPTIEARQIPSGPFIRPGYEWDPIAAASRWANGPVGMLIPSMLEWKESGDDSVLVLPNGDCTNFVANDHRGWEAFDITVGYYEKACNRVYTTVFDDRSHSIQEISSTFGIPPEKVKELAAALVYNIRDRGWTTAIVK